MCRSWACRLCTSWLATKNNSAVHFNRESITCISTAWSLARQNGLLFLRKEPGDRWCVGRVWVLRGHQWNKPCVLSSCPCLRHAASDVEQHMSPMPWRHPKKTWCATQLQKKHSGGGANKGEWGGYRHTGTDNVAVDQVTPRKPYWLMISEWDPVSAEAGGLSERPWSDGHQSLKESMMRMIKMRNYKSHLWDLWRLSIIQPEIPQNSSSIIMILWESTHI